MYEKFKELTEAQGGDSKCLDHPDQLPGTVYEQNYISPADGYITKLDALSIGLASVKLGAGRITKDSLIDKGAGILLKKKCGDYVKKGEVLAILYSADKANFSEAEPLINEAYSISTEAPVKNPLILKTIS